MNPVIVLATACLSGLVGFALGVTALRGAQRERERVRPERSGDPLVDWHPLGEEEASDG